MFCVEVKELIIVVIEDEVFFVEVLLWFSFVDVDW